MRSRVDESHMCKKRCYQPVGEWRVNCASLQALPCSTPVAADVTLGSRKPLAWKKIDVVRCRPVGRACGKPPRGLGTQPSAEGRGAQDPLAHTAHSLAAISAHLGRSTSRTPARIQAELAGIMASGVGRSLCCTDVKGTGRLAIPRLGDPEPPSVAGGME